MSLEILKITRNNYLLCGGSFFSTKISCFLLDGLYFFILSFSLAFSPFEGFLPSYQKKLWIQYSKVFGVYVCLCQFLDKPLEDRIFYPKTFSGGQRQRLSLAKVLSSDKPILLLDEPTSELDSNNTKLVFSQLKKISKKSIVICVTHNEDLISISDQNIEIS